jgi:hypothetical protein
VVLFFGQILAGGENIVNNEEPAEDVVKAKIKPLFSRAYGNRGDRIRTYGLLLPKQAL